MENNSDFINLHNITLNLYRDWAVWDELMCFQYKDILPKYPDFFITIFGAVQDRMLLEISEIFNKSSDKRTIGISNILNNINDQKLKIRLEEIVYNRHCLFKFRLTKWRNKVIAHKENELVCNMKKFEEDFALPRCEIKDVLDDLCEFLVEYNKFFNITELDCIKEYNEVILKTKENVRLILDKL